MMYRKPQLSGHKAITAIQSGSKNGSAAEVQGSQLKTPPAYEADE